jgi:hypothetical protein
MSLSQIQTTVKSLNLVVNISDGRGTYISNGKVTTNNVDSSNVTTNSLTSTTHDTQYITTDEIQRATNPGTSNLYINGLTGSVIKFGKAQTQLNINSPINIASSAITTLTCDTIQGVTNSDTISLYNNSTSNINLGFGGNASVNIPTISSLSDNSNKAVNSTFLNNKLALYPTLSGNNYFSGINGFYNASFM